MPLPLSLTVPSQPAQTVTMSAGDVLIVAGPNGVGKSALLHELYTGLPQSAAAYYPGHRTITFNHGWDNLSQDIGALEGHLYTQRSAFNRYKGSWGDDHVKAVIRKLQNAEAAYNRAIVEFMQAGGSLPEFDTVNAGPITKLNSIFMSSGLRVQFGIDNLGLRVSRGIEQYRIDTMSDGERAALFIVGAALVQAPGTVLLIDEPERHLHPSIAGPLVESIVRLNPDIAFIFASHDMSFIESLSDARILHVTDSSIVSTPPERRQYDVEVIGPDNTLPEGIRTDILGARSRTLFVEGTIGSMDRDLYSRVYDDWKVIPKGGWEQCANAARALNDSREIHWINAAALIDGDRRSSSEVEKLLEHHIYVLPCPTIENILVHPEVVAEVAKANFSLSGGEHPDARLDRANSEVVRVLKESRKDVSARITAWRVNRAISERKVSVGAILAGQNSVEAISIDEVLADAYKEVDEVIESSGPLDALFRLPIKNTGVPSAVSKAVRSSSFSLFKSTILQQIDLKTQAGNSLMEAFRRLLPHVTSAQRPDVFSG